MERHAKRHVTLRFGLSVDLRPELCQEGMSRRRSLSAQAARLEERITGLSRIGLNDQIGRMAQR